MPIIAVAWEAIFLKGKEMAAYCEKKRQEQLRLQEEEDTLRRSGQIDEATTRRRQDIANQILENNRVGYW